MSTLAAIRQAHVKDVGKAVCDTTLHGVRSGVSLVGMLDGVVTFDDT